MAGAGARGATGSQIAHALGAASPEANLADAQALRTALAAAVRPGPARPDPRRRQLAVDRSGRSRSSRRSSHTLTSDFGAAPYPADFATAPQSARDDDQRLGLEAHAGIIPAVLPRGLDHDRDPLRARERDLPQGPLGRPVRHERHAARCRSRPPPARGSTSPSCRPTTPATPTRAARHFQAVDLPYAASTLSLLAILPVGESLGTLERGLTAPSLAHAREQPDARNAVNLRIPKLHLRTQASLNAPLQQLGMTDAFTPAADFSGITRAARLQIGLVEHAADLRLDEQGTVAAGATVVVGPTAIALPVGHPVTVNLDRPFLLLLREDTSGAILFVAQVADPTAS